MKLNCKEVPFFWQCVTASGIKADPVKLDVIKCWPIPTNLTEPMSFLGSVNYLSRFIPEFSALQQPLQWFLKEGTEYIWLPHHTDAFEKIKDAVSQDCLLQCYDMSKPLFIECDASKKGLGWILLEPISEMDEKNIVNTSNMNDFLSDLKPVAYASKSLSDAETHYVNIEGDLLGVVFGVEYFKHFTYGHCTHIITDLKLLLPLFEKSLSNTNLCLSRLLLCISEYDLKLHYQSGSKMKLNDALSRHSSHNTKDGNNTEVKGLDISIHAPEADVTECKLEKIHMTTQCDTKLWILIKHIIEVWPDTHDQCSEPSHDYFTFRHELSVVAGLVLKGSNGIFIPKSLRSDALTKLHFSHLGSTKTILTARTPVFWPGLNTDIKKLASNCHECAKHSSWQCAVTLCNDPVTTQPWIALACDLFEYHGIIYLIVVDCYSKFIAVEPVADHSAKKTINVFLQIFSKLGIPTTVHCDCGANFTSQIFIAFCCNPDISLSYSN